jgi:hypothetical protein
MQLLLLLAMLTVADAWGQPVMLKHGLAVSRASAAARMALRDGLSAGWLGANCPPKAEAEERLGVAVSTDESLWDDNDFTPYVDEGREWRQASHRAPHVSASSL